MRLQKLLFLHSLANVKDVVFLSGIPVSNCHHSLYRRHQILDFCEQLNRQLGEVRCFEDVDESEANQSYKENSRVKLIGGNCNACPVSTVVFLFQREGYISVTIFCFLMTFKIHGIWTLLVNLVNLN